MNTKRLIFLTVSIDEGVLYSFVFSATDELQVARHLLTNQWHYRRLFDDLRIEREEVERLSPERLLKAIRSSRVDGDSIRGIQLHCFEDKDVVIVDESARFENKATVS